MTMPPWPKPRPASMSPMGLDFLMVSTRREPICRQPLPRPDGLAAIATALRTRLRDAWRLNAT